MKHLGDISKINGAEIEPVDIITFGSPCQDLSVAGKRAGLEGARSGLFMEAVRIIKEMREATDGKYPRFALWENVPGAFSSNKGEDFRVVLEELIKIAEPSAVMPEVPPFGWAYADSYVGDGWSLAYRVFDTQYWPRTPQRRRRIYLVADFGGQRAREILFEREGLRGHLTESPAPRKRITAYVEVGSGTADESVDFPRSAAESEIAATLYAAYGTKWNGNSGAYSGENFVLESDRTAWGLTTKGNGDAFLAEERHTALTAGGGQAGQGYPAALVYESHPQDSRVKECEGVSPTIAAKYAKGTADTPLVCVATQQGGAEITENGICPTVTAAAGMSGNNQPWVVYNGEEISESAVSLEPGIAQREGGHVYDGISGTLRANAGDNQMAVAYGISSYDSNAMKSANPHSGIYEADTSRTLDLNGGNPACNQGGIAIVESVGIDTYNGAVTGEKEATLGVNCGVSTGRNGVIQTHLIDSIGGQAERGWEGDIAPTLKASHYKFPPVVSHASGFCPEQSAKTRDIGWEEEKAPTLRAGTVPAAVFENHSQDTRYIGPVDTSQTVSATFGMGGNNQPFVVEATTVHGERTSGTLMARDYKGAGRWDSLDKVVCQQEVAGVDCRNMNEYPDLYPTLQAKPNGGQSLNFSGAVRDRYIVRRLTPTECARLQGFPDTWGHPDKKDSLSDEEYQFWQEVRNTHAAINGKAVKNYSKAQMEKWYNKLHSDSAEYKMWGNGIALPPSLYCMQGIEEALKKDINEEEM